MNENYLFKLQEDLRLKNFTNNTCNDYYRFVKRFLDFTGKEAMSITYAHIRKFIFQRNFSALYHFFHIIVLILSFYSGKQKKLCLLIYFLVFVYNFPFSFMIHSYFCHNFLLYQTQIVDKQLSFPPHKVKALTGAALYSHSFQITIKTTKTRQPEG